MSSKTVVLTLVAAGCIGAAGVGSYLAVRSGVAAPDAAPAPAPIETSAAAAGGRDQAASAAAPASPSVSPEPAPRPARPVQAPARPSRMAARQTRPAPRPAAAPNRPLPQVGPLASPDMTDDVGTPVAMSVLKPPAAPPLEPAFDELTVPADSVIGIRLETAVSSETARVEDRVTARVTRDVTVGDRMVIPAGARLEGTVTLVELGGRLHHRARIGIRFTSVQLSDSLHVPIRTEAIMREGEPPEGEATSKIGASAVVGTILGAVIGGKKGAIIGGAAGAAGGTAVVAAGGPNAAELAAGTSLTVRLTEPALVPIPHQP